MNFTEFLNKYNGMNGVGNTPENKGQCTGLTSLWMDNFGISHVFGNAEDLYTNALDKDFIKIPNTPDGIVQDGDIVVWGHGFNQTFGHTGIAYGKADVNSFDCFEQNDPLGSTPHIKNYNYAYVIGWLRPRASIISAEPMATITQKDLDDLRFRADDAWNKLQAKTTAYDTLTTQYNASTSDLTASQAQVTQLKVKLTDCQNKPPQVVEKPVEKIVYQNTLPSNFWDKLKLLFS